MNRRAFLRTAAGLLVAAPAIVRAESIMRVRPVAPPWQSIADIHRLWRSSLAQQAADLAWPHIDQRGALRFSRVLIADAATGRHIAWFDVDPPPGPGDTVTVEFPTDGRLIIHSPA